MTQQAAQAMRSGPASLASVWLRATCAALLSLVIVPMPGQARPRKPAAAAPKKPPAAAPVLDETARELQAAQAAQAAGRVIEAQDRIRRLLASTDAESRLSKEGREQAKAILELARPPAGDVVVLGEPGLRVRVDEQDIARLPLPVPLLLAEGPHQVEFVGVGTPLRVQIQVRAGRRMEVRANREAGAVMLSSLPHALVSAQLPPGLLPTGSNASAWIDGGLRGLSLAPLVAPTEDSALVDCKEQPACLSAIAQRSQADYVLLVRGSLAAPGLVSSAGAGSSDGGPSTQSASTQATPAADVLLRVALFDPTVGDLAAHEEARCDACTATAANDRLSQVLHRVAQQGLSRARARIRLLVEPAAAELRINDVPVTAAGSERTVWAGELRIQARHDGYQPLQVTRVVAEGASEAIELHLERVPPPPPLIVSPPPKPSMPVAIERQPRPLWRIVTGSLALVAGGTLVGFGVGALNVNGRCIDEVVPPANQCDRLYQTSTLGTALVASGAAAAVAGVVLIAIPGPRRPVRAALSRQ